MRIYIAHKFRGLDPELLRARLESVSALLEKLGHPTFNYFRDAERWQGSAKPFKEIIEEAFKEISKSDLLFGFVEHESTSEGMLLEFAYAKALGKKTLLLVAEGFQPVSIEAVSDVALRFANDADFAYQLKEGLSQL